MKEQKTNNIITAEQSQELLQTIKTRFEKNVTRHKDILWADVQSKLENNPQKLFSLLEMEKTGGEPDIVDFDDKTKEFIFYDCSAESPTKRRSLCYDQKALDERKEDKPIDSAINMAKNMGIEVLSEEEYRNLQKLGEFDLKTSSWLKTPIDIRKLGGAIFADRRYDTIFVYHNGASSYYASRGFRGILRV